MADRIEASEDVIGREVGGEIVLLDLASGEYFGLNEVGGRVWALIGEGCDTPAAIADAIFSEYDAPREAIEADVQALIATLAEKGLVRTAAD